MYRSYIKVNPRWIILFLFFLYIVLSSPIYSRGYICAVGGGSEDYNDWSDKPYGWIVEKSDSGKIIILGADDATNWLPNYFKHLGAKEVYNKKISSRSAADLQSTYDEIITAKAIFLRGGDQYDYVRYWKGTKTEEAIKYVYNNGGVIAGTSAGAAILGDVGFTAKYDIVDSKECIENPFSYKIDLVDNFLDLVPDVIFDTHFVARGRFGRLIAFLIKLHSMHKDPMGVGIDDMTAFCIDTSGIGQVMGSGAVTIFYSDDSTHYYTDADKTVVSNLFAHQLTADWKFNLTNRKIVEIPSSAKQFDSDNNSLLSPVVYLSGTDDVQKNISTGFSEYLKSNQAKNILLLYDDKSAGQLASIMNFAGQNGNISTDTLRVNNQIKNNIEAVKKISSSDSYCFIVKSLSAFSILKDTTSDVGHAFCKKSKDTSITYYFVGNSGKLACGNYIDNVDDDDLASYHGQMTNNSGLSILGDVILQPLLFDDADFNENRASALVYGMMRNRKRFGVYLDGDSFIKLSKHNISVHSVSGASVIFVNADKTTYIDSSKYISDIGYRQRQIAAMNNLRFTVTNSSLNYDRSTGNISFSTSEVEKRDHEKGEFELLNNYPNPFNPSTIISYRLPVNSRVSLKVYDILGKEVATIVNEIQCAGNYNYVFVIDNYKLSSGIYFYKLQTDNSSAIKKMVLLK